MNIAVVGGGIRCCRLMNVIERHVFKEIKPKVIAVADLRNEAPGVLRAKEKGLFTCNDYNELFKRDDIDLIVELTGDMNLYNDILAKKKKDVRALSAHTAQLFWEISRVSLKQKKTDQELQDTKALYKTVFNDLIHEGVLVISINYKIMDVNDSLLRNLGLKRKEVIGKYCYEITHHLDSPCSGEHHPCPLNKAAESKKPFKTTHIHLDKHGKEIYYSISAYPMLEEGDVVGAIEISRDITNDINFQKVMMQQEKLASIGRLSAGVAHEINNPLTTILTSAMLIQEDLDADSPIYEELDTIVKETLRCRKIVTSLLDFARQTKPNMRKNNIVNIVKESVLLTKKQAAFKDIEVIHDFTNAVLSAQVDMGQIEQALINIILNAVEATPSGGKIEINVKGSITDNGAVITIKDTGVGIPKENIDRIFDPFFTTKGNGTGLGLSITHGIIERNGGKIKVKSQTGKGTTFSICFPLDKEKEYGC